MCLIYFCIFVYDLLLLTDWLDSTQSTPKRGSTHSIPDQDSTSALYQDPIIRITDEESEFPGNLISDPNNDF